VIVDAHHHFWDPAVADAPWMTGPLHQAFGPGDLAPMLASRGVDKTVVVQTRSSLDETRDLLATADRCEFVAGVVGWVDLTSPDVADQLAAVRTPRLVGIRHQVHDEADPRWLSRPDVRRGLRAVADAGLVYDLLIRPRELPAAIDAARDVDDLVFVVDHLAKPAIAEGSDPVDPAWEAGMPTLAGLPNVRVKLSGMVTEADWATWTPADLRPFVERVVSWSGPDRLMWGSDWPVCTLAASYDEVYDALVEILAAADPTIFGTTAMTTYGL
jgi:L-fuconolactonase